MKLPETINEKDFIEVVKTVKKPKTRLAFMLGFYQCMRVSEVIKLMPPDVDKDRGFLHIKQAKGGKDRFIPIMKPVSPLLRHLPISVTRQALHKSMKKYFPKYHFHTLRHSGATYYLNVKKVDLRQLQQLLGHSRLDTTQIYTHVTPENLKSRFEEIWA